MKQTILDKFKLSPWKGRDRNTLFWILATSTITVTLCYYSTLFLAFNESRQGYSIYDPYMTYVPAISLNWPIFILTYITIIIGLVYALRTPTAMIRTNLAVSALLALRICAMYLLPLEPPDGIIPLIDPLLSSTFYNSKVLVKDLFFSGHTASVVTLALLVQHRNLSILLWLISIVVGSMLIIQHVHFCIDVVAAYFFSYLAFRIGDQAHKSLPLYSRYMSRVFTNSKKQIALLN